MRSAQSLLLTVLTVSGACSGLSCHAGTAPSWVSYNWPPQAVASDRYRVLARCGDEPEREVQVVMSRALHQGDYREAELEGRTFSFASLCYRPEAGPLTIRVVKRFGDRAESVTLHPLSYRLDVRPGADGKEVVFQVASAERYISVHFAGADNQTAKERWIKHMMCVFVDPLESDQPDRKASGVVTYSPAVAPDLLQTAKTIVFPAGYHNLRDYGKGGIIDGDGQLLLRDHQSLYLEGGAFVEGIVGQAREGRLGGAGQRVYGRGILSGRQYLWSKREDHKGPAYGQLLKIGSNGHVDGIMVMESPMHGIVGGANVAIRNVKFLGWHCNNDGIRVNAGSEVSHSFLRAVDDHFYNFNIHAHDLVLWAGHNGSILTYGWGGAATYGAGASLLEDIDIIHPEWTGLGNNNGLVMSQVGFDFRPKGYGGETTTVLRNIRIEGRIPGLLNLKPLSRKGEVVAPPVDAGRIGYVGDLILENVSVDAQSGKGLLRGSAKAAKEGDGIFHVRNIRFRNLRIGGKPVTDGNMAEYFDIDPVTTRDIVFSTEGPADPTASGPHP